MILQEGNSKSAESRFALPFGPCHDGQWPISPSRIGKEYGQNVVTCHGYNLPPIPTCNRMPFPCLFHAYSHSCLAHVLRGGKCRGYGRQQYPFTDHSLSRKAYIAPARDIPRKVQEWAAYAGHFPSISPMGLRKTTTIRDMQVICLLF